MGKGWERNSKRTTENAQFDDIEPPLTPFNFANERLGFPEPPRKLGLGQVGFDPGFA
jgi:hypothetical protein